VVEHELHGSTWANGVSVIWLRDPTDRSTKIKIGVLRTGTKVGTEDPNFGLSGSVSVFLPTLTALCAPEITTSGGAL